MPTCIDYYYLGFYSPISLVGYLHGSNCSEYPAMPNSAKPPFLRSLEHSTCRDRLCQQEQKTTRTNVPIRNDKWQLPGPIPSLPSLIVYSAASSPCYLLEPSPGRTNGTSAKPPPLLTTTLRPWLPAGGQSSGPRARQPANAPLIPLTLQILQHQRLEHPQIIPDQIIPHDAKTTDPHHPQTSDTYRRHT